MKRAIFAMLALGAVCSQATPALPTETVSYDFFGAPVSLTVQPDAVTLTWLQGQSPAYQVPSDLRDTLQSLGLAGRPTGQNRAVVHHPQGHPLTEAAIEALRHHPQVSGVQTLFHPSVGVELNSSHDPALGQASLFFDGELIAEFEPHISETMAQVILSPMGLELVRPLRFTETNLWLVQPQGGQGDDLDLMALAPQLQRRAGVVSVEPNFVQAGMVRSPLSPPSPTLPTSSLAAPEPTAAPESPLPDLLAQAWHLDSRPYRGQLLPRTDVQATAAWAIGNRGRGATVAVIDSTIQWDHPDLVHQVACLAAGEIPLLPEEACGYDFVEEDGDTRLSEAELALVQPIFQDSFVLGDRDLLAKYAGLAFWLQGLPQSRQAQIIREYLRWVVEVNFHGTWSAGVVAAQSPTGAGLLGVAPEAQILPVRVFDLDGYTSTARLIEATGYAAARGVDVINLSLGSLLPSSAFTNHLFELQDQYPNLVIVASAGNSNLDGAGFPAAIPGVLSVGATNLEGLRAPYSNYGGQLDLVAPGGDRSVAARGGLLTTGGTWLPALWEGMEPPAHAWGYGLDPLGQYVRVQGTSFSAPTVAGVVALMRSEDPNHRLSREQLLARLTATASYEALSLSAAERHHYRLQQSLGFGTVLDFPFVRPSGIYSPATPVSAEQYYFGAGLVNALRAVQAMQR